MERKIIIAGGGPAGLTAGIYALRARLKVSLVEQSFPGGTILLTDRIENYPGFPDGVSGEKLASLMEQQYRNLGGEIVSGEITQLLPGEKDHTVVLADGKKMSAPVVILATGSTRKKLGVPGEKELTGRGVSFCAICDAAFFRGRTVAVVGGGDAALREALHLSRVVSRCFLIHRRNSFRAAMSLQEEVKNNPVITPYLSRVVERIEGTSRVERVIVRHLPEEKIEVLPVEGIFISVGQQPRPEFLGKVVNLTQRGYIITDETMETSRPGIFACGDVRAKNL
ncbi:MAG: FAD-dependent oxidoreductase [Candidatus Omnitrophica bacterium]|nr:FAD-dependent oxidoreductase [Candidatus Omnitrophota bacterium]